MSLRQGRARFTQLLSVAAAHPSTVPSRQHFCGGYPVPTLEPCPQLACLLSWAIGRTQRAKECRNNVDRTPSQKNQSKQIGASTWGDLLHSSPPAYEQVLAHPYIRVQLNAAAAKSHTAAPAASNCKALQWLCRLPSRRPAAHPGKRLVHLCAPQPLPPVSRVLHTSAQAQAAGTESTRRP